MEVCTSLPAGAETEQRGYHNLQVEALGHLAVRIQEELETLPMVQARVMAALQASLVLVATEQLGTLQSLAHLRAFAKDPPAWQERRKEAHKMLEYKQSHQEKLQQDLQLLDGRRLEACVELRDSGGDGWSAEAKGLRPAELPALRLAAMSLREKDMISHVEYREPVTHLPRCYLSGMSLSGRGDCGCWKRKTVAPYEEANFQSPEKCCYWGKDKRLLLETSTKFTRFTSRVYCHSDPEWTHALLSRHALTLTYLRLDYAKPSDLFAVWELPALEELEVTLGNSRCGECVPPDGPSKAQRLHRIIKFSMPWSLTAIFLAAHRHSVMVVRLWDSMSSARTTAAQVAAQLKEMDLYLLRHFDVSTLTEEEAGLIRAALPEGCSMSYHVPEVWKAPVKAPKAVAKAEAAGEAGEDDGDDDDVIDLGFGLFD